LRLKEIEAVQKSILSSESEILVRFNEVDALKIVWHGHYVNYFEDGRQTFGKKYGLGYLDMFHEGYTTPIVEFHIEHKSPLSFGESAIVKTNFINSPAAKIRFEYEVLKAGTDILVAKGSSIQVFLDRYTNELELYPPDFYIAWKEKWGVI
jgi:acyl-CoA thioester hydrolase